MNRKINRKLLSSFNIWAGLLMFLLLLPLKNTHAILACSAPMYSILLVYIFYLLISIFITTIIIYFFVENKNLLFKIVIGFLYVLFFLYLITDFEEVFSAIIVSIAGLVIFLFIRKKKNIIRKFIGLSIVLFLIIILFSSGEYEEQIRDFYTSEKCKSLGGKSVEGPCGIGNLKCELPSSDYGKECNNDNDCEKYCIIDNASEIIKAWQQNYSNVECVQVFYEDVESCNFKQVRLSDWYKKTGIKVKGTCSRFYNKNYEKACSALYSQGVSVQKGGRWSNYPEEELLKVEAGCTKKFNDEMYEKMMNR